ncbi:MAG: hypothetical protein ACRDKW_11785, partial [Actinomycetota bacterium]
SGLLRFEGTTARILTMNGDVAITAGGAVGSASTGTVTTHRLQVGGDLTNEGTLDLSTNSDVAGAELRFVGQGSAAFAGTGATDLRVLSLLKGSIDEVVEVTAPFTVRGASGNDPVGFFLTGPYLGTLKLSGTATYASNVFLTPGYTILSSGGFWLDNPNFTVNGQAGSATLTGRLRVSDGTFNVGTAADHSFEYNSLSFVTIEGGAVNVAGRFGVKSPNFTMTYTQTGGTVRVATAGNTSTTLASFDMGRSAGSGFTMTGGTIVVRHPSTAGSGPRDYRAGVGTHVMTGGTLRFGDSLSAPSASYIMTAQSSTVASVFPDLVIDNTSGAHSLEITTGPALGLSAAITAGTELTLGGFEVTLRGDLVNDGVLDGTAAGSRLRFGGTGGQSWSGTGMVAAPLAGLVIENPGGVTLGADPFTALEVVLARGTLMNSHLITLGNGGSTSGVTRIGRAGLPFEGGHYDAAPAFNAGTGGVQVH